MGCVSISDTRKPIRVNPNCCVEQTDRRRLFKYVFRVRDNLISSIEVVASSRPRTNSHLFIYLLTVIYLFIYLLTVIIRICSQPLLYSLMFLLTTFYQKRLKTILRSAIWKDNLQFYCIYSSKYFLLPFRRRQSIELCARLTIGYS